MTPPCSAPRRSFVPARVLLRVVALCLLVSGVPAAGVGAAPVRIAPQPDPAAVATIAVPRTPGIPSWFDRSRERPVNPDMPGWARQLYRDDIVVNVLEIDRAFAAWRDSEARAGKRENEGPEFEENPWEEYYTHWRLAVEPYVQPDGTLDFSRGPIIPPARVEPARTDATTWTHVGPVQTFFSKDQDATVPARSWQANVYCIDAAPSDPNILYCGTETGAINRSTDRGRTWTHVSAGASAIRGDVDAIAIHRTNPNIVYACLRATGVLKSTDHGVTWTTEVADGSLQAEALVMRPGAPEEALAGGSRVMKRSTLGTWSTVLANKTYDVAYHLTNSGIAYALVSVSGVPAFYKSTDGGSTFSVRSSGWSAPAYAAGGGGRMALTAANTNLIYVILQCAGGPRVLRSRDQGESWSVVATGKATKTCTEDGTLEIDNGQGYFDLVISASPSDSNQIVVGTTKAMKSTDGGVTYHHVDNYYCPSGTFPVHPDIQCIVTRGTDSWMTTDGGVNQSTDFWTTKAAFAARDSNLVGSHFWGLGQGWNDDVLVGGRYHNGDTVWRDSFAPGRFHSVGGGETPTGYVNPGNSHMAYFSDRGCVVIPDDFNQPYVVTSLAMSPSESYLPMQGSEQVWDPRYMYVYYLGRDNNLMRTADNGASFTTVAWTADSARVSHVEVSRTDPHVIYVQLQKDATVTAPGLEGYMFRFVVDDAGNLVSYTQAAVPPGTTNLQRRISDIAVSGTDANVLWWCFRLGADGAKIFKSVNGGASWTNWTTSTLNGVTLSTMVHQLGTDGGIYLFGDNGAVYYRNNTMGDWVAARAGLPAALNAETVHAAVQYKNGKIRMASLVGIWERDVYEPSTTTLPQPMVSRRTSSGGCDTLQLESYSVVNGAAQYHWSFTPPANWISDANARNPRVAFSAPGSHAATLTVTDANGVTARTVSDFVVNTPPATQWANGVVGFSSEYGGGWFAASAVGPPDVYPQYGDLAGSWASATGDGQREFLELSYATPMPIDFVTVVETWNPGALDKVWVKNPGTGRLQLVWATTAAAAEGQSRYHTVHFPQTSFAVSDVRLDFDSPAVPTWNEVDAVGIGSSNCAAQVIGVPEPMGPIVSGLEPARPSPFGHFTTIGFTLARPGQVKAEVFSVTGQRLTRLAEGAFGAGHHDLRWDGRGHDGRTAPDGVYFIRLEADGIRMSERLLLVR